MEQDQVTTSTRMPSASERRAAKLKERGVIHKHSIKTSQTRDHHQQEVNINGL